MKQKTAAHVASLLADIATLTDSLPGNMFANKLPKPGWLDQLADIRGRIRAQWNSEAATAYEALLALTTGQAKVAQC